MGIGGLVSCLMGVSGRESRERFGLGGGVLLGNWGLWSFWALSGMGCCQSLLLGHGSLEGSRWASGDLLG